MTGIDDDKIDAAIVTLTRERGPDRTACPSEIARGFAGADAREWRRLMKPIRARAVALAAAGRISIRRKGRIVDPHDFKGVYRLGTPAAPAITEEDE